MDARNFDKEIKQALDGAEMVPSSQVWERIQVANATADKRPLLFWLATAIILTMLIIAAALAFQQYKSSADNGSQNAGSSLVLDEAEMEVAKDYGAFPLKSGINETSTETVQADQNIAFSENDAASEIISRKTASKTSNAAAVLSSSENVGSSSELSSLSIDTDLFKAKNSQTTRNFLSEPVIKSSSSSSAELKAAQSIEPSEKPVGFSLSSQKNVLSTAKQSSQVKLSMNSLESSKLGFLASQNAETSLRDAKIIMRDAEFKLLKDCYHFNPKPSKFFLDMYFGANGAWHTLNSDDPNLAEHLADRKTSEQIQSSYSLGLRIGGKVYNDFFLRSGFEYTRIDEDLDYSNPILVSKEFQYIKETIITHPQTGDTTIIIDSIFIETYTEKKIQAKNHYELISIPFEIGHQWEHKRFTYGVFGGVAVNIAFDRQGTVLGIDEETVDFNPASIETEPMFKDRIGLRLNAGVYGAYEVFQDVHIFAEPHFSSIVKPITLENQAVQKKFQFVGANIGLRFDL